MIKIKTLFLEEISNENFRATRKKMNLINNLDYTIFFNCLVLIVQTYLTRGGQMPYLISKS